MQMETIILHSTQLKDFRSLIGDVVAEKLQEFKKGEPSPTKLKDDYLTRKEVSHLLRISLSTLHYYTKNGILRGYRIGGRILYKKVEVQNAVMEIQSTKYKGRV
ncbi:MAG: helix-turn-helix domain-containing protein [bacterium]